MFQNVCDRLNRLFARRFGLVAVVATTVTVSAACNMTSETRGARKMESNRAAVAAAFERWRQGTGGPFELLADNAEWTIVGSSPYSKTYPSRRHFMQEVIEPFNARLSARLIPTVRKIYCDGDTVIVLFDGAAMGMDGIPYRNTYTWYLDMENGWIVKSVAFFDTRVFDEFWARIIPVV